MSQNKTITYFKYAVGEILLVVIGILIALTINNWNELRKDREKEQQLYARIMQDIISDGDEIEEALTNFKRHQDLHYQLYNESIGKAPIDSTIQLGYLRWSVPFEPILKDNHISQVDKITNQKVAEALNNYFRFQDRAEFQVSLFGNVKINLVRPYLTNNNLMDIKTVFDQAPYEETDAMSSINYKSLKAQFGSKELEQVLFELRVKTASALTHLRFFTDANTSLKNTLELAMNKD